MRGGAEFEDQVQAPKASAPSGCEDGSQTKDGDHATCVPSATQPSPDSGDVPSDSDPSAAARSALASSDGREGAAGRDSDDGMPIGPIIGGVAAAIVVAAIVAGCLYWRCCKAARSTPVGATHGTLATDPARSSAMELYPVGGTPSPDRSQKHVGVYSSALGGGAAPAHHMVAPMAAAPPVAQSATPPNGSQGGQSGSFYAAAHAASAYTVAAAPPGASEYAPPQPFAPSAPGSHAAPQVCICKRVAAVLDMTRQRSPTCANARRCSHHGSPRLSNGCMPVEL